MYETKKVDEPEDTKEGIVEQEDAKEGIVGARVEGTSPSSVGRRAPSRVEMKSTWGEARRRSTGVSGTISCEAWINVVGKEVRTMVGRKSCRGGGGGEAARERERASKRLAGTRAGWMSRSLEVVTAKRRERAAGSGGESGCLRERRVPTHQMETGCEKKSGRWRW